jgi:hypothetical protein
VKETIRAYSTHQLLFFEFPDYIGPVELCDIPGKGKGLVASQDIEKGSLLLASKAFSLTYEPQNDIHLICK